MGRKPNQNLDRDEARTLEMILKIFVLSIMPFATRQSATIYTALSGAHTYQKFHARESMRKLVILDAPDRYLFLCADTSDLLVCNRLLLCQRPK
jgi:hypothetical protein